MNRRLITLVFLFVVVAAASARVETVPLLALRMQKAGYENIVWAEGRAKIGKESVSGYIQGLGGAGESRIAYNLKEDWDMLEVVVGYLSTAPEGRTATFTVEAGGVPIYKSGELHSKGPSERIRVPIRGHRQLMLTISGDRYNHTAGAAWGEPVLLRGLSAEQMETSWSLSVNGQKTPVPGSGPPPQVMMPLDVPVGDEEKVYTVKVRRDGETRTVIVESSEGQP